MLDANRSSDPRISGGAEPIWWGVAALLSLAALALPNYVSAHPEPSLRMLITGCALFFTGTLVGCCRPKRVWRWALASLIAFALRDVLLAASESLRPELTAVLNQLADNAQLYFLETVLVFLGASFGSWSMKAGLD
jgi:hypothetical protein